MKKHYYLGLNARRKHAWRHLFSKGRESDAAALKKALEKKCGGTAVLTKNGRTGLAMALKAYFTPGDAVIVNGFTCFAVIEAIKAAGLVPVYADISRKTLNFSEKSLRETIKRPMKNIISGIIVQNTLGNPVDMQMVERFAGRNGLIIIEDLAHSVGVKYPDGREAGTVGAAVVYSFGKDKAIDTISGGAVVFRHPCKNAVKAPELPPRKSDNTRERLYPLLAGMVRGFTHFHLGGVLMRAFLKLRLIERSADNRLDFERKMPNFEAKSAFSQFRTAYGVEREFELVSDRAKCLEELKVAGYHFAGYWYEKPIAPERYYKKAGFVEENCPEATFVAEHIINIPTYYSEDQLKRAREIIRKHVLKEKEDE